MHDGGLGVVIGDVSGHGFGPALLMAELRAYLRALLLTRADVGEIVDLLNRALADDAPEGHFATLLLARLEPTHPLRRLRQCRPHAGLHPQPLRRGEVHPPGHGHAAGGPARRRLSRQSPYRRLEPGELLLLFTDGIVEAHGPDDKLFGTDRVLDVVHPPRRTARTIVDSLYGAVRAYCAQSQLDDMTVIVIKAASPVAPAAAD